MIVSNGEDLLSNVLIRHCHEIRQQTTNSTVAEHHFLNILSPRMNVGIWRFQVLWVISWTDLRSLKNLKYLNLYRTQVTQIELKSVLTSNLRSRFAELMFFNRKITELRVHLFCLGWPSINCSTSFIIIYQICIYTASET